MSIRNEEITVRMTPELRAEPPGPGTPGPSGSGVTTRPVLAHSGRADRSTSCPLLGVCLPRVFSLQANRDSDKICSNRCSGAIGMPPRHTHAR
jgi:hypothetical protein